jgi:hypothetical protein
MRTEKRKERNRKAKCENIYNVRKPRERKETIFSREYRK